MPKHITASYKQRKFAKSLLKHGSIKQAALDAYDTTEKSAYVLGRATLKQPATQQYMKRLMDEQKVTDEILVERYKGFLDAANDEGFWKKVTPTDLLNAMKEIAKLKDLYPAERKKIEKKTVSVKLEGKTDEELKKELEEKEKELRRFRKLLDNPLVQDVDTMP